MYHFYFVLFAVLHAKKSAILSLDSWLFCIRACSLLL